MQLKIWSFSYHDHKNFTSWYLANMPVKPTIIGIFESKLILKGETTN